MHLILCQNEIKQPWTSSVMDILLPLIWNSVGCFCVVFTLPILLTSLSMGAQFPMLWERKEKSTLNTDEIADPGIPIDFPKSHNLFSSFPRHTSWGQIHLFQSWNNHLSSFLTDLKYLQSALYFSFSTEVLKNTDWECTECVKHHPPTRDT